MVGIYKLTFSNQDFYTGRSIRIEERFTQHIKGMKAKSHENKYLIDAFNT